MLVAIRLAATALLTPTPTTAAAGLAAAGQERLVRLVAVFALLPLAEEPAARDVPLGALLGPEARRRREVLDDGAHREVAPQVGAHALVRQRRRRLLRAPPEPLADRAALVGVAVLRDHGVDEQGARDGVAAARRDRLERRLLFLLLRRRRRRRTALVGLALRRGLFILHRSGSEALGAIRDL